MLYINIFFSGGCPNCSKLVALITATDKDSGSNGEIEFQGSGGNASDFLIINTNSGLIEAPTNDMSLSNGTYLYIVNITDKGIPSRGTTVTLSFNVAVLMNTQISRVFNKDKLIFTWPENVAFPSPFIVVKDFTINPAIEKFVLPNYNLGDFYLNGSGSEQEFLYVNKTKHSTFFDREIQHQYRFIIQAKLSLYSMLAEVKYILRYFILKMFRLFLFVKERFSLQISLMCGMMFFGTFIFILVNH